MWEKEKKALFHGSLLVVGRYFGRRALWVNSVYQTLGCFAIWNFASTARTADWPRGPCLAAYLHSVLGGVNYSQNCGGKSAACSRRGKNRKAPLPLPHHPPCPGKGADLTPPQLIRLLPLIAHWPAMARWNRDAESTYNLSPFTSGH